LRNFNTRRPIPFRRGMMPRTVDKSLVACRSYLQKGTPYKEYKNKTLSPQPDRISVFYEIAFAATDNSLDTSGKVTATISQGTVSPAVNMDFSRFTRIECEREGTGDCTGPEAEDPEGTPVGEPQRMGGLTVTIRKWDITSGPEFLRIHVLISIQAHAQAEKKKLKLHEETKKEGEAGGSLGVKGFGKLEDEIKVEKKSGREIEEDDSSPAVEFYKSFEQTWTWRCKSGIDREDLPETPKTVPEQAKPPRLKRAGNKG
jgi:hypothetical protein